MPVGTPRGAIMLERNHVHPLLRQARLQNGPSPDSRIQALYQRHARAYDELRGRSLQERKWLDPFLAAAKPGGAILDLGCGAGEPMAGYMIRQGFRVVGVDTAPALLHLCRRRFPRQEWRLGDMRGLALGRRFAGILAWDSFFHLRVEDQRAMFGRFAHHAAPGAPLLFTSGPAEGESIGTFFGEALYHASLDPGEYRRLLEDHGFSLLAHAAEDPDCGAHTVWLASCRPDAVDRRARP